MHWIGNPLNLMAYDPAGQDVFLPGWGHLGGKLIDGRGCGNAWEAGRACLDYTPLKF